MPMFTDETSQPRPAVVSSTPSLACDLSWLLSVAARPSMKAKYPQLAEMFNGREDLAERVSNFWQDDADETCFAELQILTQHAGAFTETDPVRLWSALEQAARSIPLDLDMPSEDPDELVLFASRLRRLQESPQTLREYLGLLEEVWDPVDDLWQQALPLIEEAGRQVVSQFERSRSLESLIVPGCDTLRERMPGFVPAIEAGIKTLLFVPCLFFGSSLYLEFPDLIVLGTGVGQGDLVARARTESVARRLKAVADPTRLALLHALATAPSTVGDLAVMFRLAQPTVSMHVKVLRQNGLVRSERIGGRLRLSADAAAVNALLGDLRQAVLQPAGANTTGSERMPATVEDSTRSAEPVTA